MKRLLEWIFGLDRGFLNQEGDLSIQFHPRWPGQEALDYFFSKIGFGAIGATVWNLVLATLAVLLVVYVYRREGRSRGARVSLAAIRLLILAFVLALLNMPVFTIGQSRTEPSVLAFLVDDSVSIAAIKADSGNDWSWALMAIVLTLAALECFMAMRFGHYKRGRRVHATEEPAAT